ncbi:MAG: hypothetical protein B6241_05810 [Spirochaetaceae bacterium 4572_59]|nr:MAG: hypothetical protein B6241_05810 [Spirochaetaceae bacterium 4572_59]
MRKSELKTKAEDIIAHLPDNVTWDDLMQQIYVRQKIEKGIHDADSGNIYTSAEVRKRFKASR